jgi:uncharacterized protein (DUF924 family)
MSEIEAVLKWWFGERAATTPDELQPKVARWFRDGEKLDGEVRARFGPLVERAVEGGLTDWEQTPEGRIALIIVLDQLTRHVYRNQARMYAGDARAQRLSVALFDSGEGRALRIDYRHFAAMPLAHAEDLGLQKRSVAETDALVADAPDWLQPFFAMATEQSRKCLDVITRFGRFPHRNVVLGRSSTTEEKSFMETFVHAPKAFAKQT